MTKWIVAVLPLLVSVCASAQSSSLTTQCVAPAVDMALNPCSISSNGSGGVIPIMDEDGLSNVDSIYVANCVNNAFKDAKAQGKIHCTISDIGWHSAGEGIDGGQQCSATVNCQ